MEVEQDYLQVFDIHSSKTETIIIHSQEQPNYRKKYVFPFPAYFTGRIFVIDDGEASTMLLAEEY